MPVVEMLGLISVTIFSDADGMSNQRRKQIQRGGSPSVEIFLARQLRHAHITHTCLYIYALCKIVTFLEEANARVKTLTTECF
jgi:hypothetical protein